MCKNWGDYRDSNPGKQLHKLLCYRYTIVTIFSPYVISV